MKKATRGQIIELARYLVGDKGDGATYQVGDIGDAESWAIEFPSFKFSQQDEIIEEVVVQYHRVQKFLNHPNYAWKI